MILHLFLSYGKGNYFDFTKLDGLTLLNSNPENQGGKTSFAIALLSFALFGKSFRTPTLESTFNIHLPEATEVMVEACIEINNVDYVIRRTVNRPILKKRTAKSKITQKVEYFKLIEFLRYKSSIEFGSIVERKLYTILPELKTSIVAVTGSSN